MPRRAQIIINLEPIQSAHELHEVLRDALDFPDWYGRNWDAFWDAITGLIEMPTKLELHGWHSLEVRLPRDAQHLSSALEAMTNKYPDLAAEVIYT